MSKKLLFGAAFIACLLAGCHNDAASDTDIIEITPEYIEIHEGNADYIVVRLTQSPTADVHLTLSTTSSSQAKITDSTLTYTPHDWAMSKAVKVSCVDDHKYTGSAADIVTVTVSSSDPAFSDYSYSLIVKCLDDETPDTQPDPQHQREGTPGFLITPTRSLTTSEDGKTTRFSVTATGEPLADVTVSVVSNDTTEGTVDSSQLIFTADNWDKPQYVTVRGVDDDEADGDTSYRITFGAAQSADSGYDGLEISQYVSITNLDNEVEIPIDPPHQRTGTPGFSVSPTSGLTTSEAGKTARFSVTATGEPFDDVVISVISSDITEGKVTPSQLIFTPDNWDTPQTVTITGVDDNDIDGDIAYRIEFGSAQSADSGYDGLEISQSVAVTNLDNDEDGPIDPPHQRSGTPGFLITPTSGLTTSEDGRTASFRIVATGEPFEDVVVPVISSDITEGTVEPAQLIFTADNWRTSQLVTIKGVDDNEADGDIAYQITFGSAQSSDSGYDGLPIPQSVAVTNLDNDIPSTPVSFTVSEDQISVEESGAAATFTVVPNEKPVFNVVVSMAVTDSSEATISPSRLTFTPSNWNVPQTVTVKGKADFIEDGDQDYEITFDVASDDTRYDDYEIESIDATTIDRDVSTGETVQLRVMAANITSGNSQAYCSKAPSATNPCDSAGVRIFKAVKPDVVLIQEFNMYKNSTDTDASARSFVDTTFGPEYYYYRGNGAIPNGVISRYPILSSGYWKSNKQTNRDWNWAVIDLPGPRELLVISVHLGTSTNGQELPVIIDRIEEKIATDKANGQQYYVMIGGDFNTDSRGSTRTHLSSVFNTAAPYPVDQKNNDNTNLGRAKPYDWLLCSYDWCNYEVPAVIGNHTYKNGHVFDSRVYSELGELDDVEPVQAKDSNATNMQHMPVIRDFKYTY